MTGRSIVASALRRLGVLAPGETPEASELVDGLEALDDLIETLQTERLTVYHTVRTTYPLVATVGTYSIGFGATFSQVRPQWLPKAGVIAVGSTFEYPLEILTDERYADIPDKLQTADFPDAVYLDGSFSAVGYGQVLVLPVPTTAATLVLYTPTPLQTFGSLLTDYLFPPGYARMLKFRLAIELAPEFEVEVTPVLAQLAATATGAVKRSNPATTELRVDRALRSWPFPRWSGGFDIRRGW